MTAAIVAAGAVVYIAAVAFICRALGWAGKRRDEGDRQASEQRQP